MTTTMPRYPITLFALLSFILFTILFLTRSTTHHPPAISSQQRHPATDSLHGTPYSSTWGSWWHPQQLRSSNVIHKGWNILYHLGGNGPWIEKVDGIVEGGIGVPDGCRIEQVHMVRVSMQSVHDDLYQSF